MRGWHLPRHKNTLFRRKPPPPLLLVSPSGMSIFRGAATAAAVVASLFNVRIGRYTYTAYTGYTRSALRCGFLKYARGLFFGEVRRELRGCPFLPTYSVVPTRFFRGGPPIHGWAHQQPGVSTHRLRTRRGKIMETAAAERTVKNYRVSVE